MIFTVLFAHIHFLFFLIKRALILLLGKFNIILIIRMDKLPSKSLSKSILIATPLFCLVLALLDASDDLSYLFVL